MLTPFHPLFSLDMGPLHYFSVLGRALYTAQQFEANCRSIALHLHLRKEGIQRGHSVFEDPSFIESTNKLWKHTLGRNVNHLIESAVLPANVAPVFRDAVQARNEIAHEVAIDVSERLDGEVEQRIQYIVELVAKIAEADKIALIIVQGLNDDPVPNREFIASYAKRVSAWVAEDTFEL